MAKHTTRLPEDTQVIAAWRLTFSESLLVRCLFRVPRGQKQDGFFYGPGFMAMVMN
jgi:hypothetical protein